MSICARASCALFKHFLKEIMVVEYKSCVSSTFHHLLAYYFISLITSVRCPSVARLERSSAFGERAHVASSASSQARGDSPASCQPQQSCLKTMSRYVRKPNTKITGAALKHKRGRRSRAAASGRVRSWGDGCALSPVGWQLQKRSGGLFSKGLKQFSVSNGRLWQLAGAHGGGLGEEEAQGRGGGCGVQPLWLPPAGWRWPSCWVPAPPLLNEL